MPILEWPYARRDICLTVGCNRGHQIVCLPFGPASYILLAQANNLLKPETAQYLLCPTGTAL